MRAHRSLACLILPLWTACGSAEDVGPLRHVLLISMDTTRADHLGCYGNTLVRTPALDALAGAGVRFADVTAAAATTLASHTSLMTGSWPHTHGVVRNGFPVHLDNRTLAEVLRAAGFHTVGAVGSFALDKAYGFDQGFDHFDQEFDLLMRPGGDLDQNQRTASGVTGALLQHLDEMQGEAERLFLFAHYFDAHAPYSPPAPWNASYTLDGRPATSGSSDVERAVSDHQLGMVGTKFGHAASINEGFRGPLQELIGRDPGPASPLDRRLMALYAGEISYVDSAIGELLQGLQDRGILDETLIIVTADHGETFVEHHDLWNHGLWTYQTTVHVPLLLRFPDDRYTGRVVETPVSNIDVLPTLCELLQLPLPERCEGVSLVPLMKGVPMDRGPVFSEATQPWVVEGGGVWGNLRKPQCVRRGPWKYVQVPYAGVEQLFHLGNDPGERQNLLAGKAPSAEVRNVQAELRRSLDEWRAEAAPLPSQLDTRALKRLMGLGYTGTLDDDE